MRPLLPLILLLAMRGIPCPAQVVLINELQPACQRTLTTPDGGHPDWIELLTTGRKAVDLDGYTLSTGLHNHRITGPLLLTPGSHLLLWCDGHPDRGPEHLGLKLSREGGTLMLIAPDGSTVVDLFTWPALPADVSQGRCPDGARTWSLFAQPTPGSANSGLVQALTRLDPPTVRLSGDRLTLEHALRSEVRYTSDGSPVTTDSPVWAGDRPVMTTGVLRFRAYGAGALPSAETLFTPPVQDASRPRLSLAIDPADLYDPTNGIFNSGPSANYGRSGREWQVNALYDLMSGAEQESGSVGLAIAGSGSRGLPKRSFKLFSRDRFGSVGPIHVPGLGNWDELFLRADASPNAFLRNVFMERVAQRSGNHVDVTPSVALDLFLNGSPQGLYRAMPPKNGDWLMATHGEEAIDLADGPAATMLRGDRGHLDRSLKALFALAPEDTLDALIDLQSLIDLACLDLYTGRADHDLNVRCWRPRRPGGTWRWILYDMDLWAPVAENSLERMCSAAAPETPYLPQLLAHPELGPRFIARFEAMLLTVLEPNTATILADSIHQANAEGLARDHDRWGAELPGAAPAERLAELRTHIGERPAQVIAQLAGQQHRRTRTVTLETPPEEQGLVYVEDLPLAPGTTRMALLGGIPLQVRAEAAEGWVFERWQGAEGRWPAFTLDPAHTARLRAVFRRASGQDGLEQ